MATTRMFDSEKELCSAFSKLSSGPKLNDLRINGEDCNLTIRVEKEVFKCHREVLISATDYFEAMFRGNFEESRTEDITLHDFDASSFKILLDYMYTGNIEGIDEGNFGNLCNLLQASSIINVSAVENYCVDRLEDIIHHQCEDDEIIELFILACCINNERLISSMSKGVLPRFFNRISIRDKFLEIPYYGFNLVLQSLLEPDPIEENMRFREENFVLDVLLRWISHNLEERKLYLEKLLEYVSFEKISADYLQFLSTEYGMTWEPRSYLSTFVGNMLKKFNVGQLFRRLPSNFHPIAGKIAQCEDTSSLKEKIGDYFELKSNADMKNSDGIPKPTLFAAETLPRNQFGLCAYVTFSFDHPSVIHMFTVNKYETRWIEKGTITVDDVCDETDIGNVVFGEADSKCLYSLVGGRFLASPSEDWSSDSRSLQYPPIQLPCFSMCGVENDKSIYLYNGDIFSEPILSNKSTSNSFTMEEIRRGIYCYNCELDKWLAVPEPKKKLAFSCITSDTKLVYMIGGEDDGSQNSDYEGYAQAYDNRMKSWFKLPAAMYDYDGVCSASVVNGKVYVYNTEEMEVYDPIAGRWDEVRSTEVCKEEPYGFVTGRIRMVPYVDSLWVMVSDRLEETELRNLKYRHCCISAIDPNNYPSSTEEERGICQVLDDCFTRDYKTRGKSIVCEMKNFIVF